MVFPRGKWFFRWKNGVAACGFIFPLEKRRSRERIHFSAWKRVFPPEKWQRNRPAAPFR